MTDQPNQPTDPRDVHFDDGGDTERLNRDDPDPNVDDERGNDESGMRRR